MATLQQGLMTSMQSKIAPHSMLEPLAIAKKRARSFGATFPDASAIFNGIDKATRLN